MVIRRLSARAWAGIIVALGALCLSASTAYGANLLANGGFNGAFAAQGGIDGLAPAGWSAVNLFGNPRYYSSYLFCNCGGWNEKTEGTDSVVIISEHIEDCCNQDADGWPFTAVLYQRVTGVTAGAAYSFATAMLTFCGGTADPTGCAVRGYKMWKSIGIDPTGGTSPSAPAVVWSAENGDDHAWRDMSVAARAAAGAVTVFIKVRWPHTFHGAHAYLDAGYLTLAPTVVLNASAASPAGVINLTWSGQMPQDISGDYGNIQLGYNIQARESTAAAWTNLLVATQATQTTFTGTLGKTYEFRAQAIMYYPLNPAPRFAGVWTNPISVTVGDLMPPSSSIVGLSGLQTTTSFAVNWLGSDNVSPPSALTYDIQWRDGPAGTWANWLANTPATSATFSGNWNYTYYFRSRARDQAGNLEAYPPDADAFARVVATVLRTFMPVVFR